jgi:hypothetical protein
MQCHVVHEKNILILMFIAFKISCILPIRKVIPISSLFFVKSHVHLSINLRLLFWSNLISILCQISYSFAVKSQVCFSVNSYDYLLSYPQFTFHQHSRSFSIKSHVHLLSNLMFIPYKECGS